MLAGVLLAGALHCVKPPKPEPKLFTALTIQYLGSEQFGAGVGYKFKNGITLIGQGLVTEQNPDSFDVRIRCRDYTLNPPSDRKWGAGLTVLIPIK